MSQVTGASGSASQTSASQPRSTINDVDLDDFLKLMITELQNQDPLNPMENDELIQQIGQIRSVGATEKLSETLDSVLLGQSIASATNLIGAEIDGLSDDNQKVTGVVERVSVANGHPKLHLDLNPKTRASTEEGSVEAGEYEYRVVWQSEEGQLVGVDPLATEDGKSGTIKLNDQAQSVLISNLPASTSMKQVYRRKAGTEDFHLIGSLTDVKAATFLDTTSNEDLSDYILSGTPQLLEPTREFTVSLKNVGEIRPPNDI